MEQGITDRHASNLQAAAGLAPFYADDSVAPNGIGGGSPFGSDLDLALGGIPAGMPGG